MRKWSKNNPDQESISNMRGNMANLTHIGVGRKKGVPNKTTRLAKEAIHDAFEQLGGIDSLVHWAQKNQDNLKTFYTQIWPKIIPLQVRTNGKIEHEHTHAAAGLSSALEWFEEINREAPESTH